MEISVVVPTHQPDAGRLARTLAALGRQTLASERWELVVVDNASDPPLTPGDALTAAHPGGRILREERLGLSHARRCGLTATAGPLVVFVDDDNVLAETFLEAACALFARRPQLGAAGGPSRPEYAVPPPDWIEEFAPLLALRDHGPTERFARGAEKYPVDCAPIGAGMVLRRAALSTWLEQASETFLDRTGQQLSSAGDNHLVLTLLAAGWEVGYCPELALTHLIPAGRLEPAYLARLARAVNQSWMRLLTHHGINPWPPLGRWTAALRIARAWCRQRPWSSAPACITWNASRGHFEGRVRP